MIRSINFFQFTGKGLCGAGCCESFRFFLSEHGIPFSTYNVLCDHSSTRDHFGNVRSIERCIRREVLSAAVSRIGKNRWNLILFFQARLVAHPKPIVIFFAPFD
jgi:hypothetical protein